MFTSYAQNFEDVMLRRALSEVARGFYIDVGAQDPIVDSVSMGFYEAGWRGVHVEPVASYAARLRVQRPDELVVQAALGAQRGTLRFFDVVETGLSTADPNAAARYRESGRTVREIEVPCLTLAELMAPYADIDVHWLKIDVEGYETAVLQGWTSAVRPWIVVVEGTAPLTQAASHHEWEELLLAHGYAFAYFDGLNRFYIRGDHEELRPAFAHGPSVFDRFALSGTASSTFASRLRIELDSARDRAEELKREADAKAALWRASELRARDASQRMDAALRHIAAMEATISWRVTTPLRWLSRRRNAASERSARSLRTAAALTVRAAVSVARRSGLYSKLAPWLRSRYPRLWRRAKRVAIAAPAAASRASANRRVASFAADRWVPRTTRDTTIIGVPEIERLLEVEIRQRHNS
jgi:FkbM family methyltransferase